MRDCAALTLSDVWVEFASRSFEGAGNLLWKTYWFSVTLGQSFFLFLKISVIAEYTVVGGETQVCSVNEGHGTAALVTLLELGWNSLIIATAVCPSWFAFEQRNMDTGHGRNRSQDISSSGNSGLHEEEEEAKDTCFFLMLEGGTWNWV
jgi:hypothetical protein